MRKANILFMELNKVFRSKKNEVFTRISANEIRAFEGNFISVVSQRQYELLCAGEFRDYGGDEAPKVREVACVNGVIIPMPEVLYNEIGVEYYHVNYAEHGKKMARKHGVYKAVKQECIRIWTGIKPGTPLKSVIDGFVEHEVPGLREGHFAAQNVIKGEFYAIPADQLAEKYELVGHQFDFDLYKPKADAVSEWVYSDINVYGLLWEGLEFLTTPMINITKESDVYGCNYQVFWGWDGKLASYKVLGYFRGCGAAFYPGYEGEPCRVAEAPFEPPKAIIA